MNTTLRRTLGAILLCLWFGMIVRGCINDRRDSRGYTNREAIISDNAATWARQRDIEKVQKRYERLKVQEGVTRRVVVLGEVLEEMKGLKP